MPQASAAPAKAKRRPRTAAARAKANAEPRALVTRSRVTNGAKVLPGVDNRTHIARRYRDIQCAVTNDLGGADRLSEAMTQMVRRFAGAAVLSERMEARLALGEAIDITEYSQLVSTLTRVVQRIGKHRIPKEIAPTLEQVVSRLYREPATIDAEAECDQP